MHERGLVAHACALEDKSKQDERVPSLLFDDVSYDVACRTASVSHVRLHARAAARYGSTREAADCAARCLRSLWLLDAVPAPFAPRPTMFFAACCMPASVVDALRHHNLAAIKSWLDLDDAHLGARDRKLMGLAHWAVAVPWLPALDELVRRCAPLDLQHHQGATPLYVAALMQREDAVRRLLDAHANPELADYEGTTPLMVACRAGATGAVNALLDAGADPTRRDRAGGNALTYAVEKGRKGVCMIFRQRYKGTRVWGALRQGFEQMVVPIAEGHAGVVVPRGGGAPPSSRSRRKAPSRTA